MGRIDMNPPKRKNLDAISYVRRDDSFNQEKPVHHEDPIELTRVKLQALPEGFSSSVWSSDGITRSSRLFQRASSALPGSMAADRPGSFSLRPPTERVKRELQRSPATCVNAGDSEKKIEEIKDHNNQAEDITQNVSNVDIQTSWTTSPISNPLDNQTPESSVLDLVQEDSSSLRTTDIWTRSPDELEKHNYVGSGLTTGSSASSPVNSDTQSVSESTYDTVFSCQVSQASSCCDESINLSQPENAGEACHAPPGMSLIDRIQEDFSRTPSPVFGRFSNGNINRRHGSAVGRAQDEAQIFHTVDRMNHLCLDNPDVIQHREITHPNSYLFGNVSRPHQSLGQVGYPGRVHGNHLLNRGAAQPAFAGPLYPGTISQPLQAPFAMGSHGHHFVADPLRSSWLPSDDSCCMSPSAYPLNSPNFAAGLPSGCRVGSNYHMACSGMFNGSKAPEKVLKFRPSYNQFAFQGLDHRDLCFNGAMQPHRSRSAPNRRGEYEHFNPIAHSYSSNSLLEEFNSASKSDKWELSTIKGHLLLFARDQSGSRFIQQKLEKADDQTKNDAFEEVYPNALLLMTDVFGNYVIQKFFEYGSLKQQQLLVEQMENNMINLALQVYGCRVIQRALEVTQVNEQLTLIRQLKGYVMKCVVDQNGNHVLQKCIEAASWKKSVEFGDHQSDQCRRVTGEDIQFIIDGFIGQAAALSTHSYGCRVIQRVLEHCSPQQIRPILNEIIFKCRELVKDQFGNYVVQHVISHGEPEQRNVVMQTIFPEIARWSQHKYASNVVEACLEHATKDEISQIIDFILECDESGASCPLLPMMKHMYGNYVVQKLLDKAEDHDRQRIVCIIRHNADYLRRFTFGKHVLSRLERETQRCDPPASYY